MNAMIALAIIGGLLGILLGVAHKYLYVEIDNRIEVVTEKLPGVNCGGCGFPGCSGFATALVEGEATKISKCVAANALVKEEIRTYLNNTPGPDGEVLHIEK